MNEKNDTSKGTELLDIFCYKVLVLPIKQYWTIFKWTWINCKCILKTLACMHMGCHLSHV